MKYLALIAVLCVLLHTTLSASTANSTETSSQGSTTKTQTNTPTSTQTSGTVTTKKPEPTTPKLTPMEECQNANGSCDKCVDVGSVQCVWCDSSKTCLLKEHLIPTGECSLSNAKWGVCWVNYEALIISMSVIGCLLILGLTVCICCCCCCKKKNNTTKYAKEDDKYNRKRTEMKASQSERRAQRKVKTDEIRRKYGLIRDDNPYTRFDENTTN